MNKSELIGELAKALCKAQGDFGPLIKGAENPFFKSKYADLSSVMDVARGPLAENGLCFVQTTEEADAGFIIVETTLIHISGEWISGRLKMPTVKNDPQGFGSAMTYARRYSLQAILGLAAEDDDAEGAVTREPKNRCGPPKQETTLPPVQTIDSLCDTAIAAIEKIDSLAHLSNHFKKHFAEYESDPQFNKIIAAKDKRKAELTAMGAINDPDPELAKGVGKHEPEYITEEQARDLQVLCEEVGADIPNFLLAFKAESFEKFPTISLKIACQKLQAKRKAA